MPCPECEHLDQEHAEAEISFRAARERLQTRLGVLSKPASQRLLQDVLISQERLNSARAALDRHTQRHGCAN